MQPAIDELQGLLQALTDRALAIVREAAGMLDKPPIPIRPPSIWGAHIWTTVRPAGGKKLASCAAPRSSGPSYL